MLLLNEFSQINEDKEGKNLHLTHIEDQILMGGVRGTRDAINFLRSLRDMLAGHSKTAVNVTTKFDGAPAIFCGTNPENGQFFVGTKSIFNKTAKLNYTEADIDANHPSEGLASKLKIALRYLPKLGIKGILQGDMMFSKGDLKSHLIDGEKMITFQPNTLTYAVPENTHLAQTMMNAQMGVVFHTSYTGKTMADMKASYNVDIGHLQTTKDVWFRDASYVDASGTASFTEDETDEVTAILSAMGNLFQKLDPAVLNRIASNDTILTQIMTYNNTRVREGEAVRDVNAHTQGLITWVEAKLNKEILSFKKDDAKRNRELIKKEIMMFYKKNILQLRMIFDMMRLVVLVKNKIVKKLQQIKSIGTFMKTDNGFRVAAPEGFVAVSKTTGDALKLVDRLGFSFNNFTVQKDWTK